jgi:hypothetical protein
MKEEALKIRKTILPMKDAYEELDPEERIELKELQKQHDDMYAKLSDADKQWYDSEFSVWYAKYLDIETKIFIKPSEGC